MLIETPANAGVSMYVVAKFRLIYSAASQLKLPP
jgi:hypothetical protein